MSKRLTIEQTADWLRARDNFLLLTHRRPDGDTAGSAGALSQALREIGKTAYVLCNPEVTPRYLRFIEEYLAPEGYKQDYVIAVDTASLDLYAKNAGDFKLVTSLCIDHHPSNTLYAELTCLEESQASCGEVIFEILMALSGKISPTTAGHLYAAVATDTGCFVFANTTANTLRVASLLIEAGAPHRKLNKLLFRTKTRSRVKIDSMLISGLEYYYGGTVAIAAITRDMMAQANATEDDLDDISSVPGSIEGVSVGITICELKSENDCKVSVRTTAEFDAHAIAAHFGGGGHKMAAGFSRDKTIPEIKAEVIEVLKEIFPHGSIL